MHLIFHIIRKDFRRVWPLLATWWAALVLQALVPLWFFSAVANTPSHYKYEAPVLGLGASTDRLRMQVNNNLPETLAETGPYFIFAGVVLIAVMAAMLIQEDSPGVERAHWQLLPVTRGKMVAAKLLFFAIFIGITAPLAGIAAKMFYGLPASDWLAGSEAACLTALFCVAGAAVPMLLLQSATARVLSVLGLLGFFGFIVYWNNHPGSRDFEELIDARMLWLAREFLAYTFIIALLRYQRVHRVICLCFTALGIELVAAQFLIYDWPQPQYHPSATRNLGERWVEPQTVVQTETVLTQKADKDHDGTAYTIYGKLAGTLPITVKPGQALLFQSINGPVLLANRPRNNLSFHSDEQIPAVNLASFAAYAGLGKLLDERYESAEPESFPLLDYVYPPQYPSARQPPAMDADLNGQVGNVHRWPDLPLTSGAGVKQGTEKLEYLGTQSGPGGETIVEFAMQRVQLKYGLAQSTPPMTQDIFLLWNQARGECVLCTAFRSSSNEQMTAQDMDFTITRQGAQVKFSYLAKGELKTFTTAEIPTWLAGAKLVRLTFTPLENLRVPITVGPITLPVTVDTK